MDAVREVGHVQQRGPLVPLHHHLQLALGPLDQRLGVRQGHVFGHGPIDLQQKSSRGWEANDTNTDTSVH